MAPVKVAVLGAGYFGSLHAKVYSKLPEAQLVAVCDHDQARAEKTASAYGAKGISDLADLPGDVEAVSIAVPTTAHYTVAKAMLERGLHILVEKPVTTRLDEVDELDQIAKARGLIFQVGHLERFNPVMLAAREVIDQPRYLECRRISPFPDRGTDVNVVLDLMIHDLDLVLSLVPSELVEIDAIGVPVLTPEEDIANARLRFADGCTANITASRVSRRKERVIRVFQHDCYLVLDLQDSKLNIIRRHESADSFGLPDLETDEKKFEPGGNLDRELAAFLKSVRDGSEPLVTAQAARRALAAALEISAQLKKWNGAS